MISIAVCSQRVDGYLRRIFVRKLTRIELRDDSIESPGMNGFELRGIDAPLFRCNFQAGENGWQCVFDVPTFVAANDAPGPVNQHQVFFKIEQDTRLLSQQHQMGRHGDQVGGV